MPGRNGDIQFVFQNMHLRRNTLMQQTACYLQLLVFIMAFCLCVQVLSNMQQASAPDLVLLLLLRDTVVAAILLALLLALLLQELSTNLLSFVPAECEQAYLQQLS